MRMFFDLAAAESPQVAAPPPAAGRGSGHRRLRLAMYGAFAAVAVAMLAQGLGTLREDQRRIDNGRLIDEAAQQRAELEEIGRAAALLALADPAQRPLRARELGSELDHVDDAGQAIQSLLVRQIQAGDDGSDELNRLWQAWREANAQLASSGQALLQGLAEGDGAGVAGASGVAGTRQRQQRLQDDIEPALHAAQAFADRLRRADAERAQSLHAKVRWGMLGMLALLALLAAAVVEPSARSIRRHARRLHEQAAELQRLALVAEHTSALVLISDRDDRILWVNAAFERLTGWTLAAAAGRSPDALLASPLADAAVLARVQVAVRVGRGVRQEWLHRSRDGVDLWLDVDLRPLRDEHNALTGFVRVCSDVSARAQQQAKLQALWAALPTGVMVLGADGSIVDVNRAAERMLGQSLAELRGRSADDPLWQALRDDGTPYEGADLPAMRTLASGEPQRNQTLGVHTPEGELRWLLVNTEPQRDLTGQVTGVVACFGDVTESRALQERLSDSARTDALTRLPNRVVVMERLQRAIEHARRHAGYGFAVLFMDLDRFKQVNDTLGHGAGDELLRQVAARLERSLRPGDAVARMDAAQKLAARLGGDEFVVVLEGVHDAETARAVAQRLLADLGEPYLIENQPLHGGMSVGIVLVTHAGVPREADAEAVAETVLRNADTAMYEAKRGGRGHAVLFDESMHERVVRALALETDLRQALAADELFVVYQPVVALAQRAHYEVEALVRWRHPVRGLIAPAEFIGVAEECGLIDAIGERVLHLACHQFMAWQRELGPAAPRGLAVNLSRAQLARAALVGEVAARLREVGMPPAALQFEITESLAAQDERVQATLRELKGLGVRLALDDFGTGYSSLACLHQMPVDTVKIDRSFVRHAETVEYHRVLIEATIRVARTLGMRTVAEGIETDGQATLMQALACDHGQGFLFSRPLEAPALAEWARQQAEPPAPAQSQAQALLIG
ncbi:MAG: EAL domain-containing protein [Burkholderiales bacterium]|nr:EAL domain-containing protein [Burkholderiales bacterium]